MSKTKRRYIKYQNRKLHEDGSTKSYISGMEEIAESVARGDEVSVVDDLTGEDVTISVLARIVYDLSRASPEAFTVEVLSRLIIDASNAGTFPEVWPGYGQHVKRRKRAVPSKGSA